MYKYENIDENSGYSFILNYLDSIVLKWPLNNEAIYLH